MNFICLTYTRKSQFKDPMVWLHRVQGYAGLLEALARKTSVISIDRIGYIGEQKMNGVLHSFPDAGKGRFSSAWRLNQHAKSFHPDIVLVQGMIFPVQVLLLRLQLGRKVKIIVQNHAEKAGKGRRKLLQRLADTAIDAYLFTAKEMGQEWLDHGIIRHPDKIRQVMEASSVFTPGNSHIARTTLGVTGDPVFLWVGRLDANKDPLTVVNAFLQFSHPTAKLYMLFHTRELLPDLMNLLEATPGGKEKIILIGEKKHEEMEQWFRAADYIISGSHYEGGGIAVCEAMSCGCIPILTDILSFRMMTGASPSSPSPACGILYPPGDASALLSTLSQITAKDKTTEKQKTLTQFQKELSFQAIADTIHDIAASL
ncbi:MAG TPA: glycosyltransferase family 4 protein [Puia sp.]|jgi:glycosyltransferase involved in cell wall biosynthesis